MASVTDLDTKRGEMVASLDAYKQAVVDFAAASITQTQLDDAKVAAQTKADEFAKLIAQVKKDNPSLTNAELFSRAGVYDSGKYETVAQIMLTGTMDASALTALIGSDAGAAYDISVMESLFQDSGKVSVVDASGQPVGAITSVGEAVKDAIQTSSTRRSQFLVENGVGHLAVDGVEDFYVAQNLLASDELTLVYAVRRAVGAEYGRIFDSRGNGGLASAQEPGVKGMMIKCDNTSPYASIIIEDGNHNGWYWSHNVPAEQDFVMTFRWSANPFKRLYRVNGVAISPSRADGAMGSPMTTGAHRLFASMDGNQFFKGRFYGALCIHRAMTDEEVVSVENVFAGRLGITLG